MKLAHLLVTALLGITALSAGCMGDDVQAAGEAGKVEAAQQEIDGGSPKILIAYYSLTGTTRRAAEAIQAKTGGDLFEIQAAEPYPTEHDPCLERDIQEIKENARPQVANKVADMTQYDVVFIGYPIWYYQAPMLINTFLEGYDLQGKLVVPFCTSGGYPIDNSIEMLKDSLQGARLAEGLRIDRSSDLDGWLSRIGVARQ